MTLLELLQHAQTSRLPLADTPPPDNSVLQCDRCSFNFRPELDEAMRRGGERWCLDCFERIHQLEPFTVLEWLEDHPLTEWRMERLYCS